MTQQSLQTFLSRCESHPQLRSAWHNLKSKAIQLYPAELERGAALENHHKLSDTAQKRYTILKQEYEETLQKLQEEAKKVGVSVPQLDLVVICRSPQV